MAESGEVNINLEEKRIVPVGEPRTVKGVEQTTFRRIGTKDAPFVESEYLKVSKKPPERASGRVGADKEDSESHREKKDASPKGESRKVDVNKVRAGGENTGRFGGERGEPPTPRSTEPEHGKESMFKTSWLVENEEEFRTISSDSLRMRIRRLHEVVLDASRNPDLMTREDWRGEYLSLMRDANQDRYPEDNEAIRDYLIRINDQIARMAQQAENLGGGNPQSRQERQKMPFQPSWFIKNEGSLGQIHSVELRGKIEFLNAAAVGDTFTKSEWKQQYYSLLQDIYMAKYPDEDPAFLAELTANIAEKINTMPEDSEPLQQAAAAINLAAIGMHEAAEAQQAMARGEALLEVEGKTVEGQREYVRGFLDRIEKSNRDTHDPANNLLVRGLETVLEKMHPEIRREVRARLAVHDCSELIKQASGWIFRETEKVGPGFAIGSAAAEAERREHALDREIVETFLRVGYLPGLDVPMAWNLLQELNYDYKNQVKIANRESQNRQRVSTKDLKNFFKDRDPIRKDRVRKFAITKLIAESGVLKDLEAEMLRQGKGRDKKGRDEIKEVIERNAQKSFQLAEKLSRATLEESVFNRGENVGNDQLAEIFGLKAWRAKRREEGRERGPAIHERAINGFGTSWIRLSDPTRGQKEKRVDRPIYADEVKIENLRADWAFYCAVLVTRYKLLDELLLDRGPKPGTFNLSFLQKAQVYFTTADKPNPSDAEIAILYPHVIDLQGKAKKRELDKIKKAWKLGPQKLKAWWVAGVLDVALTDVDLGWDQTAVTDFTRALYREKLSPEAGTFINTEQWNWVEKETNLRKRLSLLTAKRVLKQAGQKI